MDMFDPYRVVFFKGNSTPGSASLHPGSITFDPFGIARKILIGKLERLIEFVIIILILI